MDAIDRVQRELELDPDPQVLVELIDKALGVPHLPAPIILADLVHQVGVIGHCAVEATESGLHQWSLRLHTDEGKAEVRKRLGRAMVSLLRLASSFEVRLDEALVKELARLEDESGYLLVMRGG